MIRTTLRKLPVFILLIACNRPVDAQIGRWNTHTDMSDVRDIAVTETQIWAATGGGVFRYDRASGEFTKYTNTDGLASIDARAIAVDGQGRVFAGAADGYVSVRSPEGGWEIVPDIARATDKPLRGINVIRNRGDQVYIGTDFGVSVYHAASRSFRDTWLKFGGLPSQARVLDVLFTEDSIWVATDQGLACAELSGVNLQNPEAWKSFSTADGLPDKNISAVGMNGGAVFAFTPKGAAARLSEQWAAVLPELDRTPVTRAVTTADTLYLVTGKRLFRLAAGATAEAFGPDLNDPVYLGASFRTAAARNGGGIYAAGSKGFTDPNDGQPSFKRPDGPLSNLVHALTVDGQGRLWSATGPTAGSSGVNVFDGIAWRTYSKERGGLPTDAVSCVATGRDGTMFLGTWGNGILHLFADDSFIVYSPSTVIGFPGATVDSSYAVISGLAVDSRGTLWVTHYQGSKGTILSSRSAEGIWRFHRNPWWDNAYVSGLTIDQLGNKWMWFAFDYTGAVLFNEKGTPDDPSDDVWQRIDRSNFIEGAVKCAVADRIGDIWVGTSVGPRTVFNPATPDRVSRTCYNTRCNIEGVPVNCIAIDAVNNKWLGTSEGVFVLSPDGGTIMAHYTTENSPLIDNMITSITVHPQTGAAFIGTVRGLSSVTTPYIEPAPAVELRVSPNPFRAGIDDRIMIEGLPEGSALKILTIAGDLVAELETPGGGLGFWDGKRADGTPAASGVYIIVAYQTEGGEIRTGKLALVRQ